MPDGRKLLIVTRELALLQGHYENVMVALAEAGVDISVRYLHDKGLSSAAYRETLERRGCSVTVSRYPFAKRHGAATYALRLRQLANLLRFYHPDYRERSWLRESRFEKAAPGPSRWARRIGSLGSRVSFASIAVAQAIDQALPPWPPALELLEREQPDLLVAVPVVRTPGFVDVLKAATHLGIPTAVWIQSWDNLSSKGLIHVVPSRVFVWNEVQREELARYHDVPSPNVFVSGAQTFDHWLEGPRPSSREEFARAVGFDPALPVVLYLGSSRQAEQGPETFFDRWLAALRASDDPVLASAFVLARPHPTAVEAWTDAAAGHDRVAVSTGVQETAINSDEFRRMYRDELHHATVAVAVNTSGMIDAAIFGKPVCTVELPELAFIQRGTVHFEYLTTVAGGLLRVDRSLEDNVRTLASLIRRDPYARDEQSERFVQAFVRGSSDGPAWRAFTDEMLRLLDLPREDRGETSPTLPSRVLEWAAPVLSAPLSDEPARAVLGHLAQKTYGRQLKAAKKRRTRLRKRYLRWRRGAAASRAKRAGRRDH
jgi:hypothetical protein